MNEDTTPDALREENAMLHLEHEELLRQIEAKDLEIISLGVELEQADFAARISLELDVLANPARFGDVGVDTLRELVAKGREMIEQYHRDKAARADQDVEFELDPLGGCDHGHDLLTEEYYDPLDDDAYRAHLQDMIDLAQAELDRRA